MASPGIINKTSAAEVNIQAVAPESITGASAADKTVGMAIIPSKIKSARGVIFISNRSIGFKEVKVIPPKINYFGFIYKRYRAFGEEAKDI
jgi:ABC-type ATPase involved in cell division